eukprot:jgi/Mesen1/2444/ME000158S01642
MAVAQATHAFFLLKSPVPCGKSLNFEISSSFSASCKRRKAIIKTAELGFDLLEVPVARPDAVDTERTRELLLETGLLASTSLGLRNDADISSADREVSDRGKELLLDALRVTSEIGALYLTGVTYSAINKYPGPFQWGSDAEANLMRSLREVADRARDVGVTLGLEVVNRYETNVLNTAQQGMELLAALDRPNVVLHLDTYHMHIEENSMAGAIKLCGDKLGYVHIGESHRGYLGSGNVHWQEVFRALSEAQYKGPLTFESFSSKVVNESLSNTLCVWRDLWEDSDDLARQAKAFIDSHWTAARITNTRRLTTQLTCHTTSTH